jgi:hypothetical protein
MDTAKEPATKEPTKPARKLDRWLIYAGLTILVVVAAGLMLTSAPTGSGGGGSKMPVRSFSFPSTSMELRCGWANGPSPICALMTTMHRQAATS